MPRELRVLYPYHFPMVNNRCISAHETRWCRMPGIAAEIIHLIANHMNISIVSVEHDRSFGVEDVSWSGRGQKRSQFGVFCIIICNFPLFLQILHCFT